MGCSFVWSMLFEKEELSVISMWEVWWYQLSFISLNSTSFKLGFVTHIHFFLNLPKFRIPTVILMRRITWWSQVIFGRGRVYLTGCMMFCFHNHRIQRYRLSLLTALPSPRTDNTEFFFNGTTPMTCPSSFCSLSCSRSMMDLVFLTCYFSPTPPFLLNLLPWKQQLFSPHN